MKNNAMVKLFCFPFAGGAGNVFLKWKPLLAPEGIEVVPIEPAGRGKRFHEPLAENIEQMLADIMPAVLSQLDGETLYAFWGHSLGGSVAFEAACRLGEHTSRLIHLFLSGRKGPQFSKQGKLFHLMPDEEFIAEIIKLGGTSAEVLENPELLKLFLPVLRSDFAVAEKYRLTDRSAKLACPFTVFYGKKDNLLSPGSVEGWKEFTTAPSRILSMQGGHMFILEDIQAVADLIRSTLIDLVPERKRFSLLKK